MTETLLGARFAEIKPEPMERLLDEVRHMPGYPDIVRTIANSEFRDSHEHSKLNITWRYLRSGLPVWLAVLGILHGYSSPSDWRLAHRVHRRLGIRKADFTPIRH